MRHQVAPARYRAATLFSPDGGEQKAACGASDGRRETRYQNVWQGCPPDQHNSAGFLSLSWFLSLLPSISFAHVLFSCSRRTADLASATLPRATSSSATSPERSLEARSAQAAVAPRDNGGSVQRQVWRDICACADCYSPSSCNGDDSLRLPASTETTSFSEIESSLRYDFEEKESTPFRNSSQKPDKA